MDFILLMVRVAVWLAVNSGGGGPTTESIEDCARGQIVPC